MTDREQFDHSVGADRFKVVRGAYWWHVLIGDSPTKHGKFHTQSGAEEMAALLLREFRNGAFVQHKTEPEPEPVAWMVYTQDGQSAFVTDNPTDIGDDQRALPLYTSPPTRRPLTEKEILELLPDAQHGWTTAFYGKWVARAIERAHGIKGEK